ncbi:GntR family transcriptional regulator [Leucobacter weissii]|uniref:GntR family transcriptional regulator n=1 Tax=Leucobacter weissii TaxID=1983706 RepID=UPI0031330F70
MEKTAGSAGRIADALRADILSGAFAPGERIRQEVLAERYGASRLPVRDALRALEAEGLVIMVPNTGAWVAKLSLEECQEVYQVRERVEPLLLRMSMPGLDAETRDRLLPLVEAMRQEPQVEEFLRLDREFHMLTYSGAESTILGDLVERLWNTTQHYRRAFTLLGTERTSRTVHLEHEMLALAILRDDPDGAERVLLGHISSTRLELSRHPEVFHRL